MSKSLPCFCRQQWRQRQSRNGKWICPASFWDMVVTSSFYKQTFSFLLSLWWGLKKSFKVTCQWFPPSVATRAIWWRGQIEVTFTATFIAATAALHSDRAWARSPPQSAWQTHRKSTLEGRPGGRDRALSARRSDSRDGEVRQGRRRQEERSRRNPEGFSGATKIRRLVDLYLIKLKK